MLFLLIGSLLASSLLFSSTVLAQNNCQASSTSCEAYSCLEEKVSCGEKGYFLKFGLKNCENFLEKEEEMSPSAQAWMPRVRLCLQAELFQITDQVQADAPIWSSAKTCKKIKKEAFKSHVDCYVETGFCELSWSDRLKIARIAGKDAFLPQSISTEMQILSICHKNEDE